MESFRITTPSFNHPMLTSYFTSAIVSFPKKKINVELIELQLTLTSNFPFSFTDGEAGNYLGAAVYKSGAAASACPTPTKPKDGLCA